MPHARSRRVNSSVDVLRGPRSALDESGLSFAVVNILRQEPDRGERGSSMWQAMSLSTADHGARRGREAL